ncbi:MAG: hypothetical protein QOD57_4435 [Actinomycetota bacterium]|nr:hypothetical protein [Actinomycetota bacterium]MDQ1502030.1 hypothetical protein [Actinomycetota bacterium]MDQ1506708.1 hypothetical protein [Actinomycetota bacterium]
MSRRRWAMLAGVGAGAIVGLSTLPGLGATVPPGGAAMTRRYDPATAATTFTVDVGEASHATLSLVTCPGAHVLDVGGPGVDPIVDVGGDGTTITFPSEQSGTYRVVLAGDTPGLGVGAKPSACGTATLLVDPAVVERATAEIGPSTRITTLP